MPLIALPVVAEGVVVGGAWAYRAYQVYRAARAAQAVLAAGKALEEMEAAQAAAKPDGKAEEKTDSQAKADAATSADCKNCSEDPDCQTARDKLKDALYGTKGEDAKNRGLAERICHWLHGTSDAERASHMTAVKDGINRVQNAFNWLTGAGKRPVSKAENATMKGSDKKKMLKDCDVPADLKDDTLDLLDEAKKITEGKTSLTPMPRADFAAACTQNALGLIKKALGK